ncbi:MAG: acyltransferase domain-containing protein [Solirubrobacterales bacterium]|nr:acyltransferase domain-containing protein [Solirubrobacterales bacterium]
MEEPHREHPLLRQGIDLLGFDPFDRLAEGTRTQQPALFLVSMAVWAGEERDTPAAAAGHSLGEYAALTAAGAIAFEDAVKLVDARATAMADAAQREPGGMVAMLGGDAEAIAALGQELGLSLANDNAPGQVVLSGRSDVVDTAAERAGDLGARAMALDVGGAFHSPLMAPAADALRAALEATDVGEPAFPVISNGSAAPFTDIRAELAENLLKPVRWRESLLYLHAQGVTDYVECGPGAVLRGLVKRTLREAA